jgi:hypothetical protein
LAADFKSHVLLRDEKGLFGIPFKRLLLAGVGGGMTYTIFNLALTGWSIPVAVVTAIAIIVLTAPRGGIPLWTRLIYRFRGTLLLIAARFPRSPIGQLVQAMELPVELVRLEGSRVFAPPSGSMDIDLREWITFAHAAEKDGLIFVDAPMKEGLYE